MAVAEFPFPILGLNEGWATDSQPVGTSPALNNVRPYGTFDERGRGGQRPGLTKGSSVQIASTEVPVVQLLQVTVVAT